MDHGCEHELFIWELQVFESAALIWRFTRRDFGTTSVTIFQLGPFHWMTGKRRYLPVKLYIFKDYPGVSKDYKYVKSSNMRYM